MKGFIVSWSGSCFVEAETPEEALAKLDKNCTIMHPCSSFKTEQYQVPEEHLGLGEGAPFQADSLPEVEN